MKSSLRQAVCQKKYAIVNLYTRPEISQSDTKSILAFTKFKLNSYDMHTYLDIDSVDDK